MRGATRPEDRAPVANSCARTASGAIEPPPGSDARRPRQRAIDHRLANAGEPPRGCFASASGSPAGADTDSSFSSQLGTVELVGAIDRWDGDAVVRAGDGERIPDSRIPWRWGSRRCRCACGAGGEAVALPLGVESGCAYVAARSRRRAAASRCRPALHQSLFADRGLAGPWFGCGEGRQSWHRLAVSSGQGGRVGAML